MPAKIIRDRRGRYPTTSFYLQPIIVQQLDYICDMYGIKARSAVITRLIAEAYTILKYVEQK